LAPLDPRSALRWFALFAGGVLLLALPWPGLRQAWARGYGAAMNAALLSRVTFGERGHAHLRPAGPGEAAGADNIVPDSILELRVDGYQGELKLGASLRRDGYLPLVFVLAAIATAPLPWRGRLRALAVGLPAILILAASCQWLGLLWIFSHQLRGVLELGPASRTLVEGGFETLLLPPANRFLVPLLLGFGLALWPRPRARQA
jgi:hypothetical protein